MNAEESSSESSLLATRRQKLHSLTEAGVSPFGGRFDTDGSVGQIRERFAEGATFRVAGRVTAHRDMGKSHFLDLSDLTGRIQFYVNLKNLTPEQAAVFALIDLGDFLGIEGEGFVTKTGEPTIRVARFVPLSKALRPLPDKHHGLVDVEARHRQRYLDLIANEKSRETFQTRSRVMHGIRTFFHERGFLEVETPMMQPVAGGAAAAPFKTHHNALGLDLYLRIAPELYLKRLLVGGFPKVFELNRNFRNEGLSRRHNPEFTMLEAYWAYADFALMADLMEDLICQLAGREAIELRDAEGNVTRTVSLARPWRRARYRDLIEEVAPGWFALTPEGRLARAGELGLDVHPGMVDFEVTQLVFEKEIEAKQFDPLFVTHLPKELVPLAKQNAEDPSLVDVFELVINGMEFAPGYTELNDPDVQRARLVEQSGGETMALDEEFLLALEHGMPPAGGIGLGIDRLLMLLTGSDSIRDVILFPHLRPKEANFYYVLWHLPSHLFTESEVMRLEKSIATYLDTLEGRFSTQSLYGRFVVTRDTAQTIAENLRRLLNDQAYWCIVERNPRKLLFIQPLEIKSDIEVIIHDAKGADDAVDQIAKLFNEMAELQDLQLMEQEKDKLEGETERE